MHPPSPLGSLSGGLPIVADLCTVDASGGGCEGMQGRIPIINNLKVELTSSNKDEDASTETLRACQSGILTNLMTPSELDTAHILRAGVGAEHDLYLEAAVFPDDVTDEDETAEVLSDLRSLCEVFGDISSVWIEKINRTPLQRVETGLPRDTGNTRGQAAVSPSPWVFIEYDTVEEAVMAAAALNGLHIGGEALLARMYSYSAYAAGKCSDIHCCDAKDPSLSNMNGDGAIVGHSTVEGAVVAIRNYVTADDLESCCGDSEELGAIKREIIDLIGARSSSGVMEGKKSAFVRRVTVMADSDSSEDAHPSGEAPALGSDRLAACVRYSSLGAATAAMLSLDGTLLGGSRLRAWVKRSSTAPQSVSPHASASLAVKVDDVEDTDDDTVCSCVGILVANQIVALRNIETPQSTLDGHTGAPLTGSGLNTAAPVISPIPIGSNTKKTAENDGEVVREEAIFPVQSAYKEATLAPKLEKNRVPGSRSRIKVLECDYCCRINISAPSLCSLIRRVVFDSLLSLSALVVVCKVAEKEVDVRVKEFLSAIATFQEKLKVGAIAGNSEDTFVFPSVYSIFYLCDMVTGEDLGPI
jgi:hypothetical protein